VTLGSAGRPHVLIVGAGIIGASIAWHLARDGARVSLVDARAPGGLATGNSWAWINASWGNPEPYFRLRVRSMAEWRRLEREVPGLQVSWRGGLIWDLPPAGLDAFVAEHSSWGYDLSRVDRAEVLRLEPQLARPPEIAAHAPGEGSVEPLAASGALLAAAEAEGATVLARAAVRRLVLTGGRVTGVETDAGRLDADEIIVAAGVETAALAATAGVMLPLRASSAMLVASRPLGPLLNGLIVTPEMELRQTAEGRLLAAADFDDAEPGNDAAAAAAALFDAVRRTVRSDATIEPEFHRVAHRPIPQDGFSAVGRAAGIAGLYLAVTHSGITLAPAIGRFVADEILSGRRDALLAPYGPDRFTMGR
jgi:glycine/D-amino acid oxidase-like deaminating enzyme